jgi:uncharacterized protein
LHTNSLIHEKSPYLLQHAHNPVDWLPWGEDAFAKARREDKPIFLSVGYSTCHWCHVMERESFENEKIAAVLNEHFVPVKLDREERPDIDRIYMLFVQATQGGGGWPMSVFLTPELKPFFGGTYFPPENRYGRPGFPLILERLADAWRNDRARIDESSANVTAQLAQYSRVAPTADASTAEQVSEKLFSALQRSFDQNLGGFGGAPKFPRPVVHNFLLRHYALTKNEEALEMVLLTLREMARGGMNDQLGGGFHRYSVDALWFVPHFEKMLYDQAQLVMSYVEAFQATSDERYARLARGICEYVLRDMTHPEGGFYSAEDADSVIDPAQPHHKGEGAFYIWTWEELFDLLGDEVAPWLAYRYGCVPAGNVQEDPHQEFTGRNILYESRTVEQTARQFEIEEGRMRQALAEAEVKLLAARGLRVRPHLDDKILTAWNGLMISAFAQAGAALGEPRYVAAAQRAAAFVRAKMLGADGVLLRRYRDGEAAIPGFLDDYAFFTQALLDLYSADFDASHLRVAAKLGEDMLDLFEDRAEGAFYSTPEGDRHLILRIKDDYDGAEPAGNSAAVLALLRLHELTRDARFQQAAERALQAFAFRLREAAVAIPQMASALLTARTGGRQIVLTGTPDAAVLGEIRRRFAPFQTVLRAEGFPFDLPELREMKENQAVYVCQNFACQMPVRTAEELARLLD